jgi:hypothetical protein
MPIRQMGMKKCITAFAVSIALLPQLTLAASGSAAVRNTTCVTTQGVDALGRQVLGPLTICVPTP